jgi:hypothetical protein
MTYDWRGGKKSAPTTDTTLSWDKTFHQRKAQLAKKWDEYNYAQRMTLIERLLFYSAITDIQEV